MIQGRVELIFYVKKSTKIRTKNRQLNLATSKLIADLDKCTFHEALRAKASLELVQVRMGRKQFE